MIKRILTEKEEEEEEEIEIRVTEENLSIVKSRKGEGTGVCERSAEKGVH